MKEGGGSRRKRRAMSSKCVKTEGRMYRTKRNIILNVLLRGLPKPLADVLKKWAEEKRRVEMWICTEE